MSSTAQHANEFNYRLGNDLSMLDASDEAYLDTSEVEDVDLMTKEQRQQVNAEMFDYFFS